MRETDHRIPAQPAGTAGANFINPGIVSSAESVFELDIWRERCVEKSRVDDLRFNPELIEIADSCLDIGQFLAADGKGFS